MSEPLLYFPDYQGRGPARGTYRDVWWYQRGLLFWSLWRRRVYTVVEGLDAGAVIRDRPERVMRRFAWQRPTVATGVTAAGEWTRD